MSRDNDTAEIGRAIDALNRQLRDANWDNRESGVQRLRESGYEPVLLNESARHYRIRIKRFGWIDFWPSSWKWAESERPRGQRRTRGSGFDSLIAHLDKITRQ